MADPISGKEFYFKINTGTVSVPVYTRIYCEGSFTISTSKTIASTYGKCASDNFETGIATKIAGNVSGSGHVFAGDPGLDALRDHALSTDKILFETSAINGKKWSGAVDLNYSETGEAEGVLDFSFDGPVNGTLTYGS